ncbi:ABC transporter permease subunit [Coriobacteriales bacterium OH1046]|nr:ABC transporter permease subunit [Coriobacteriales bacterium OH1046]
MPVSGKHAAGQGRALRALVLACALLVSLLIAPPALALTTNKATARPNEDGGHNVIGGLPTRLTWEGTVDAGEQVVSVTLTLPGDGTFEDASVKVTVLDGLDRVPIGVASASAEGDSITVAFSEPIPAGSLLRLELEDTHLPSEGGAVSVTGSYATAAGATVELEASEPIAVIANTWLQQAVAALDASPAVQAWNSNQFLGMFFKPQLMLTSLFSLFPGWLVCLAIVLAAYPFAIALGLLFALMKISHNPLLRAISVVYINILRGTPLFLQIYIMFFGLPMLGIVIDNNVLGVAVMAINSSAYLAEIFRAGIQSIPQGQYEAAASLGMNRIQTMFTIILPQTVRRVIPTVTSDFITSYKDTSLLSSVGVMELMMFAKNATSVSGNITPYVTAALFYLVVTLPLIKVVGIIEKNLARSERGQGTRPGAKAKASQAHAGGGPSLEIAGSSHFEGADGEHSLPGGLLAPFVPAMPAASMQRGDGHGR